jgi:hypothetical protein
VVEVRVEGVEAAVCLEICDKKRMGKKKNENPRDIYE